MMFTFLRWSRASDTFIATYLRSVSFHLITNVFLAGWYLKYLNRDDVGHQGGGGGNHLFSPLVVREICFRTGKRDEFEGDGRHANDRGRFHGVMITLILPEGWLAGRDEHGPDMISRAVNEHGVSTLDLALWTPGIQSGAGRLGACGCMTLSAREDECVWGAYLPKQESIRPVLRLHLEEGFVSLGGRVGRKARPTRGCYLVIFTFRLKVRACGIRR